MITLDDFNLDKRIRDIFTSNMWTSPESILLNLEKYKFIPREEILYVLNSKLRGTGKEVVIESSFSNPALREEVLTRIQSVEELYNVKVKVLDFDKAEVVASVLEELDVTDILFRLPFGSAEVKYVTPMNYREISGKDPGRWNYSALMARIVMDCMTVGGSDIHISSRSLPEGVKYYVAYRIGNLMKDSDLIEMDATTNKDLIYNIIQDQTSAYSGDLDSIYGAVASIPDVFGDKEVALRISANKTYHGYNCVCRIQHVTTSSKGIPELGFSEEIQRDLYRVAKKRTGLSLITGAIRTGKSTTAFAIANEMSKMNINIVDYSSPVEILMPFTQVDYNANTEYLIELVRLSKKQDVDVLLINEIPDKEIALAIKDLINSSVHVITTFHIDRLWHLPHKLEEYFGEDFKGVLTRVGFCINQKMFEKQCSHCRSMGSVSGLPDEYKNILTKAGVTTYYSVKGCDVCKDSPAELQPYVERIYFDDDLVSELLRCKETYEMEFVLKSRLEATRSSFEYELSRAISKGDISVDSLDSIL